MKTTADVLEAIDEFFANEEIDSKEKRHLWNILSALRGPDETSLSNDIKWKTTAVLRSRVFPKGSFWLSGHMADVNREGSINEAAAILDYDEDEPYSHFGEHILMAISALRAVKGQVD